MSTPGFYCEIIASWKKNILVVMGKRANQRFMTFCWFESFFIRNNRLSIFISRALLLRLKYYSSIRRSKIIDPIETNHRSDRDIGHFGPFAFLRDKNLRQIWYFKFDFTYFLFQLLKTSNLFFNSQSWWDWFHFLLLSLFWSVSFMILAQFKH